VDEGMKPGCLYCKAGSQNMDETKGQEVDEA
jgi:hypothetical protein